MAEQAIPSVGVFTEQNRAAIAANFTELYAGSGGGGSLTHQATRVITHPEILHLIETPIELIPAPGADRVIVLGWGVLVTDFAAAGYVGAGTVGDFLLFEGAHPIGVLINDTDQIELQLVFSQAGSTVTWLTNNSQRTSSEWGAIVSKGTADVTQSLNAPIVLEAFFAAGELTGGDAANTFTVSFVYAIYNVSTGLFE